MAGGKLSPRQKMINMMYLVLTALLALNVSKEIINAFVTVNESLESSKGNIEGKNNLTYNEFKRAMENNPKKWGDVNAKALVVKKASDDMVKYLQDIKDTLIRIADQLEPGKPTPTPRDMEAKENYDDPTRIMCGQENDGRGAKATELKKKFEDYKKLLLENVPPDQRPEFQKQLELALGTKDPDPKSAEYLEDNKRTWEMSKWYHNPVVATAALITKYQGDIRNSESNVIDKLLASVDAKIVKMDQFEAKMIPNSTVVTIGNEYKADVFLSATSTTMAPDVFIGATSANDSTCVGCTGTPLPVEAGVAKYTAHPGAEGEQKWGGVIRVKQPDNSFKYYPFNTSYISQKPNSVVSADKMNVLYIGVENPMSISVPGVPNGSVKASIQGGGGALKPGVGGGHYIATVSTPGEAKVTVNAEIGGKMQAMGTFPWRVKRVPNPIPTVNSTLKGGSVNKGLIAAANLIPVMENFDFQLYFRITSFQILIAGKKIDTYIEDAKGNQLTQRMKDVLGKCPAGTSVVFQYIRAQMDKSDDKSIRELPAMSFTLQ